MDGVIIGSRKIGYGNPCYMVAEMSANHHKSYEGAVEILHAAKESGADAVKVQTYRPDTITMHCDNEHFRIHEGTWAGQTLYELYEKAYMPWEWQPKLKEEADKIGLILFSSPFDFGAVDFLAQIKVSAYKIASFELIDIPLVQYAARQGKPLIMSTGMASLAEIEEAVKTVKGEHNEEIILLKCVSAYPASTEDMNLRTIPDLADRFGVPVGLSDHTLDHLVAVAAVSLGACIIEKHLTLSRKAGGPDASFSLEPDEFKRMVDAVRTTEKALGGVAYGPTQGEEKSLTFRRSLFVVQDMKAGDRFSGENVRSIRPAHGLHPRYLEDVIGRRATRDIPYGSPLDWGMVEGQRDPGECETGKAREEGRRGSGPEGGPSSRREPGKWGGGFSHPIATVKPAKRK